MDPTVFFLALLSAALMALGIVLSQFGLRHLSALSGASISVPTSAVFFLLLSPVSVGWSNWHTPSALIFALAGLFYPAAVTLLNFVSNHRLGANLSAAMGNLTPLFAVGLAALFLGDLPGVRQLFAMGVIFAGLGLIALARSQSHPSASLLLLLIPLAGAVLRGAAQPMVKVGMASWPNAFAAATISYVVSAVVIWSVRGMTRPSGAPTPRQGIAWFMGIGLVNGLALLTLYAALSLGQVSAVAPIVATYPLITYAINRLVLRQAAISARGIAGILLSVLGIILLLIL